MRKIEKLDLCVFTLVVLSFLICILAGVAKAEDSLPFSLKCPDIAQCQKGEPGQWIPTSYARELLADTERLEGARQEIEKLNQEIASWQKIEKEYSLQTKILQQDIALKEKLLVARDEQLKVTKTKAQRRLRVIAGSMAVNILLAGIIVAAVVVR